MIKKCKITNVVNGIIYGVTKTPIRNNTIVDLNSGQILHCLLESNVDEILSDGTLVRLNKSNYNKNNESEKVYLVDETKNKDFKEENKDEQKQEETKSDEELNKLSEDFKEENKDDRQKNNNLKKRK